MRSRQGGARLAVTMRTRVLAIPAESVPELMMARTPAAMMATLTRKCRNALEELSRATVPPDAIEPELLKPADEELLQAWPVSKRVNRSGNDEDVSLVDSIEVAGW
jgi:hypothetical protein